MAWLDQAIGQARHAEACRNVRSTISFDGKLKVNVGGHSCQTSRDGLGLGAKTLERDTRIAEQYYVIVFSISINWYDTSKERPVSGGRSHLSVSAGFNFPPKDTSKFRELGFNSMFAEEIFFIFDSTDRGCDCRERHDATEEWRSSSKSSPLPSTPNSWASSPRRRTQWSIPSFEAWWNTELRWTQSFGQRSWL